MRSAKLATVLAITMIVLMAFISSGTMAQELGAAPAPSPLMESAGMALQVPALFAASFMADLAFPERVPASLDLAPALLDHILGSPELVTASLDHVFAFPDDDLALDIEEDQDMDIDEENQEIDFKDEEDEWEDDQVWLMASFTPPTATSPVRPVTPPSPLSAPAPLLIDPVMLVGYQTTTSNTTPWIPPTLHRFQQERDHELRALHVRLDRVKCIQTRLRISKRVIERDIRWLGECPNVIHARTLSLVRKVDRLIDDQEDVLDVVETKVTELRYMVDATLDARAEILDLQTSLSASESSEMTLSTILLKMEERISALEQRPSRSQGPPDGSR
ncbi:hypothetical protein Tco_0778510 [Tanacetum coccineum]